VKIKRIFFFQIIDNFKKQSREYGVPFWRLPDFLLVIMAVLNILAMGVTYYWATQLMEDPREAVFLVAIESILILVITNVFVESDKKIIDNQKIKKEFINIISHQIRSPVTVIKWNLEMIENSGVPEKQKEYLDRVSGATKKMEELVNDFINLSRLERKEKIALKKVQADQIIKEAVKSSSTLAKIKNVKVKIELDENNTCVMADQERLQIVFDNLVDNAIKYSNPQEKVTVEGEIENDEFLVKIRNKGVMIKQKDYKNIFKKFYRTDEARKYASTGSGLGLYICKTLLNKMGGDIWIGVSTKKEVVFFVTLPVCE
jgi:signal transduction histidine kinase